MAVEAPEKAPLMEAKPDEKILEKLYVLDFDRTLVDSTRLAELLLVAMDMCGYGDLVQKLSSIETTSRGSSFSPLRELRNLLNQTIARDTSNEKQELIESELENIHSVFVTLGKDIGEESYEDGGFFEPGARELLASTEGRRMIFTYGVDHEWQTWKLEAAKLTNEFHDITTEVGPNGKPIAKPKLITRMWSQENDCFEVRSVVSGAEPVKAKNLIMVDDKIDNLRELPQGVRGYFYLPERAVKGLKADKRQEIEEFLRDNQQIQLLRELGELASSDSLF